MKCQHCGKELNQGAKFCDGCGAPVQNSPNVPVQNNNQPVQYQLNPDNMKKSPNEKKPIYKKWWFWLIVVLGFLVIYGLGISNKEPNTDNHSKSNIETIATSENKEVVTTEVVTTAEPTTVEPTTEKPTEDPKITEQNFKDSCDTIDFKTLSRNPDKYKGNKYKFTGEVIQVQEGWFNSVDLRINITKEEFEYIDDVMWTDTIYATVTIPDGEDNILVDDILTFWGVCDGEYTYETVLGNSISLPKISIEYYEINE
jgi:hypothetical protein